MKIIIKTSIKKNYVKIFELFNDKLFLALRPPLMSIKLERFDGCNPNDEVHIAIFLLGIIPQKWVSKITEFKQDEKEIYFIDMGLKIPPPIRSWTHRHRIVKLTDTTSEVIDDINYTTGFFLADILLYPFLYFMFFYRVPIYKRELS